MRISRLGMFAVVGVLGLWLAAGCGRASVQINDEPSTVVVEKSQPAGPPPWAPAHGYRNKVHYRYYYDSQVYFNAKRGQYHWRDGDIWRTDAKLPTALLGRLGLYVELDLEGDRPQRYHGRVKAYYPPGQHKHYKNYEYKEPAKAVPAWQAKPKSDKKGHDDGKPKGNPQGQGRGHGKGQHKK